MIGLESTQINIIEEKIRTKLTEWIDPEGLEENVFNSHVLLFHYNPSKQHAIALVRYEDMIEIDFLFYSGFAERADLSCDQRISLLDEEDQKNKPINNLIIEAVKTSLQTLVRRLD